MTLPKCSMFPSVALVAFGLSAFCTFSNAALPLKILGFDDMSCQAWSNSKNDADQRTLFITWIRGFITGHNYARPGQQVSVVSSGTIEQYVTRYCSENPAGTFVDAASRMTDQFSGRNTPITK